MDIIFWDLTHSRIFFRLIKFNEKGTLYWKVLSSHNDRSSRSEVFCKNGALRNFTKFTWKRLCQSLSFERLKPATLLKKKLWHRYFSVNFAKLLRTLFFQSTSLGCFCNLSLRQVKPFHQNENGLNFNKSIFMEGRR